MSYVKIRGHFFREDDFISAYFYTNYFLLLFLTIVLYYDAKFYL